MKVGQVELDFCLTQDRCSAPIKDQPAGWRARRGYGNTCQRHAVYVVDGRKLCRIHAGNELLDKLLEDHPTHFYTPANQPMLRPHHPSFKRKP